MYHTHLLVVGPQWSPPDTPPSPDTHPHTLVPALLWLELILLCPSVVSFEFFAFPWRSVSMIATPFCEVVWSMWDVIVCECEVYEGVWNVMVCAVWAYFDITLSLSNPIAEPLLGFFLCCLFFFRFFFTPSPSSCVSELWESKRTSLAVGGASSVRKQYESLILRSSIIYPWIV